MDLEVKELESQEQQYTYAKLGSFSQSSFR